MERPTRKGRKVILHELVDGTFRSYRFLQPGTNDFIEVAPSTVTNRKQAYAWARQNGLRCERTYSEDATATRMEASVVDTDIGEAREIVLGSDKYDVAIHHDEQGNVTDLQLWHNETGGDCYFYPESPITKYVAINTDHDQVEIDDIVGPFDTLEEAAAQIKAWADEYEADTSLPGTIDRECSPMSISILEEMDGGVIREFHIDQVTARPTKKAWGERIQHTKEE